MRKYKVNSNLSHDRTSYKKGDTVLLKEDQAKTLLRDGVVVETDQDVEVEDNKNVQPAVNNVERKDGDVNGEAGRFGTGDDGHGALLICSDGTMLEIKYGKADMGVWGITLLDAGSLFVHINPCMDEDADPHSDIAHFKDGLKWAYVASDWEKIK